MTSRAPGKFAATGKNAEGNIERVARVVHEAVRAWQLANGEAPSPPWSRAAAWMKAGTVAAIEWRLANPTAPPSAQHDQWVAKKLGDGWKYGRKKDGVKKTHPMLIAYSALPESEKRKDLLVSAVIDALAGPLPRKVGE